MTPLERTMPYISVRRLDTGHIGGQKDFQRRKILLAGQEEENTLRPAGGMACMR